MKTGHWKLLEILLKGFFVIIRINHCPDFVLRPDFINKPPGISRLRGLPGSAGVCREQNLHYERLERRHYASKARLACGSLMRLLATASGLNTWESLSQRRDLQLINADIRRKRGPLPQIFLQEEIAWNEIALA